MSTEIIKKMVAGFVTITGIQIMVIVSLLAMAGTDFTAAFMAAIGGICG